MVRMAAQPESRFDPFAGAHQLDLLHAAISVLVSKLLGGDACGFDDPRVQHELSCGRPACGIEIRHGLGRGLDRRLPGTLRTDAHHDALLGTVKTDDGGGCDRQRENDGQRRPATFFDHRVRSTRRTATPSMVKRGRPTNPSGTGVAWRYRTPG